MEFDRLIDPSYWFEGSAAGPATPITYGVAGLFALLLLSSLFVWLRRRRVFPGQRIKTRLASQLGPWLVTFAAIGLASSLLRVAEFPILSARVLWLAGLLGWLGIVGYVAWYRWKRYPAEQTRLAREEMRQRFIPKPARRKKSERRRR